MNILIAEDIQTNRKLLRAMFEAENLVVFEAADGVEALAVLDREKIDAVISDIPMPRMDGYRFCLELRKSEKFNAIPFPACTSTYTSPSDAKAVIDLRADKFLKRPLSVKKIIQALQEAVKNALHRQPKAGVLPQELDLMKEYNERLLAKLEKKNEELQAQTEELLEADEQLRLTPEKLRRLLAHSPAVIYTLKIGGQNVAPMVVSENIEQMLGVTVAESTRYEWWLESLHPEDRDRVVAAFAHSLTQGGYSNEYRIRHKNGTYRWVEDNNRVVRNVSGQPKEAVGVWTDITERKRAEQRLTTEHAITQALAESGTLVEAAKKILQIICQKVEWHVGELWTLDRGPRRLRCVEIWHSPSTEFKQFVTVSRQTTFAAGESLPGRVYESGQPVWIADVAQESDIPRKALATRLGLNSAIAFPIKVRDETVGVIDFFSAQIRSPDNELLAMFATVGSQIGQFIERKQLEEELRQSQKIEVVGQLVGGVAHDFSNLLTVIQGYSQMLLATPNLAPQVIEDLKEILVAGKRATNLTRQLLMLNRKQVILPQALDLNEVVDGVVKMLRRLIGENIDLTTSYAVHLPLIEADPGMVEQVLVNLAVNARDAMPKGGKLFISTAAATIDEAAVQRRPESRAGAYACLSVRDTGCGMAPEILAYIFEPFFTTKEVGKGTGLGLAMVFGIVKQHQGWIEVESQVGMGTTFSAFLPFAPHATATAAAGSAESKIRGGSETILVVEDEDLVRRLAVAVLQRQGYRVLAAISVEDALKVWEQHGASIDLLLTDMVMPGDLTGRELAEKLKAQQPALKVIYTSGYSPEMMKGISASPAKIRFLQKPYQFRVLSQAVREALDSR